MSNKEKATGRKTPKHVRGTPNRTAPSNSRGVSPSSPRNAAAKLGSKQSLLATRLAQPAGAKIADLTKELNWLPHTVRAALTRLRQQGYAITRSKSGEGDTVYRATPPATEKKRSRATAKKAA